MNDKAYKTLIKKAWKLIFKHGKKITSKSVSDLLKDQSLVPTWVSDILIKYSIYCLPTTLLLEHIF